MRTFRYAVNLDTDFVNNKFTILMDQVATSYQNIGDDIIFNGAKTEILSQEKIPVAPQYTAILGYLLINHINGLLLKNKYPTLTSEEESHIIDSLHKEQETIIENIRLNFNFEVDDMIEQINNLKEFTDNKFKKLTARVDRND
jgi:hypothetical protein